MTSRRNLANYLTFDTILTNRVEIQTSNADALVIYDTDPNNPVFSFNPTTSEFNMTGQLNVTGDASFETIVVNEFEGGMQALAGNNPGNTWDLGINANYNDGVSKYTGIIKDVSDSLQRWTFFKEITTTPVTTVDTLDSTKLDSVRMNYLYVNDGTAASPSITFHNDTTNNTGLYLPAQNEIGISAGGTKIAGVRYVSGSSTEFELDSTTNLKLKMFGTIDDSASATLPSVTTGHLYLSSLSASDKWMKFYSFTNAATPSFSGAVFTSPNTNYFLLNTSSNLELVRNTLVTSASSSPDYRDVSTTQLFVISGTVFETKLPITVPLGSASSPSVRFVGETNTGIYRSGSNSIGLSCAGTNILNITGSNITSSVGLIGPNGSVDAPAYSFSLNTQTGIWRNSAAAYENMSFSASGSSLGYMWLRGTPQWVVNTAGTAAVPAYTMSHDVFTGLFSPTNEGATGQLSISLATTEIARFRPRSGTGLGNIQFYNKLLLTPDGTTDKAAFYVNDSRFANTVKAYDGWFQSYNLIESTAVILYTFRSSGTVGQDYSGNAREATLVGSPTTLVLVKDANDIIKRDVLDLANNTSKYLNLTSYLSAFSALNNTSISFWFNITGTLTETNTIFCCYGTTGPKQISIEILADGAAYPNALQVTVNSNSLTTLQFHTATSSDSGTPSPVSVKDGVWHHVLIHLGDAVGQTNPKYVIFFDNNELSAANNKLYYTSNGDNSGTPEASTNSFNDLTFNYVSLGALYNGSTGSLYYTGYLKDFYITGRLVSTAEISRLSAEPYIYTYGIDAAVINVSQINFLFSSYFADGTAAEPSLTFVNDPDLGFYRKTSNTLGISTSGVERLAISDNNLLFNSGSVNIDVSKSWLELKMGVTSAGKIVFTSTDTPARHWITSNHNSSVPASNYLTFTLYDVSGTDGDGLGTNAVFRIGQTAAGPNTALITTYGIHRTHGGTVSAPAYAFTDSTGLGLYRIGEDDLGISAAGTLRLEVNSVVTVGNAAGDATTRLYVPSGTTGLPSYSFIGDTDTGILSSAANNVDISCGNVIVSNFSSAGQLNQLPLIIDYDGVETFLVRKNGDPAGGDIFSVDTTNNRIGFGFNSGLYLSRYDAYDATTHQRLGILSSGALTNSLGLVILNADGVGTNTGIAELTLGKAASLRNAASMSFYYVSDSSTSNKIQFGFNTVSNDQFNIKADGSTNVTGTFTVSSTSTLNGQIQALTGSVGTPSYSFIGNATTGFYYVGSNTAGITGGGVLSLEAADDHVTSFVQHRFSSGTVSLPGITFNSDGSYNTGLYFISENKFGITNGAVNTWIFSERSIEPHQCLNEIQYKPDGSNIRLYIHDTKLRASSNQTILNITPIIHFKFTNNISSLNIQDESISKQAIISSTATYITSSISLTDSTGLGLLQYTAVELISAADDRIETAGNLTNLTLLSNFVMFVKFKLTSTAVGSLCEFYGDKTGSDTTNFIRIRSNGSNELQLIVTTGINVITAVTTTASLTTNKWYNVRVQFDTSAVNKNRLFLDDTEMTLSYSTGSTATTFTVSNFSSTSNPVTIVGGISTSTSALGYYSEFYIAPLTTTETVTSIYRTQAHELYTNKIQLGRPETGIINEGSVLISDSGNNMIWNNSIQFKGTYIQLNNSNVLRLPNGSVSSPALAFVNDVGSGLYRIGSNNLGVSINGSKKIDIGDTNTTITNELSLNSGFRRAVSTNSTTSDTLTSADDIVLYSYSADATDVTVTLPSASGISGRQYLLIKTGDGGGNLVINTASGSEFIDDDNTTTVTLTIKYDRIELISDGSTHWFSI